MVGGSPQDEHTIATLGLLGLCSGSFFPRRYLGLLTLADRCFLLWGGFDRYFGSWSRFDDGGIEES